MSAEDTEVIWPMNVTLGTVKRALAHRGLRIVLKDDPTLHESKEYLLKAQIADLEAKLAELQNVHGRCRRVMSPADRKVLDEMAALPDSLLEGLKTWPHVAGPFVAELARREEKV